MLPGVGSIPPLIAYTYDGNNRLAPAGSATYDHDANGNLTSISGGQTFTWNVFNRLTQTTGPGGTVTYTYTGDGLKLRRVGPDGTTNYYHDGIRPIWETNASGQLTNQYDRDIFGNLLSRRDNASVRWYYHHDGLGNTSALTDSNGAVVATMLYDAWGNIRASSGSSHGNYRFTGAERDTTTGLYHMGARFYDPVVGRWLSEDPVQDKHFEPVSLNFYAYVGNNPLIYLDPHGTEFDGGGGKPRSAAERIQAEINLRLELEEIVRLLESRGFGRLAGVLHTAIDRAARALEVAWSGGSYADFSISAGYGLAIVAGVLITRDGAIHPYVGVSVSFPPGFSGSITVSPYSVTPGWNLAVTIGFVIGVQFGSVPSCGPRCNYWEAGLVSPQISVSYFRVW